MVTDGFDIVDALQRGGVTRNKTGGLAVVLRSWSNGFCNDLEHCVSSYGNEKLTFGSGTRLTIIPSKYFIFGPEISCFLTSRSPV